MSNKIETGRITAWLADKGFGFIQPEYPGADVFVHQHQLAPDYVPAIGDKVSFTVGASPRHPGKTQAQGVAPID